MQLFICHHYLLLTSAITTELDSIFDVSKKSRRKSIFDQFLAWHVFATNHSICPEFHQHLHMSFQSFQKLVGLLNILLVDQEMASLHGGAIIPELCDITLQYLAGSYTDIFFLVGISQSSFFHLLWKTIKAINKCAELQITWPYTKEQQIECACGFTSISTNCALCECVAVLDGYHLQTTTPSKKKVHNVQSYFSGHYQT